MFSEQRARDGDEYKGFHRKLNEYDLCRALGRAVVLALLASMFEAFDMPIFWPLLLFYFVLLVVVMFGTRFKHMAQHGYLPWEAGKKKYGK